MNINETKSNISTLIDTCFDMRNSLYEILDSLEDIEQYQRPVSDRTSRDFHAAIETNYPDAHGTTKDIDGKKSQCPYCGGNLYAEYIQDERYLVKCDTCDPLRIQYIQADTPYKALCYAAVGYMPDTILGAKTAMFGVDKPRSVL